MNYDRNLCYCARMTEQRVVVTLGIWTYRKQVTVSVFGNCLGFDIIAGALDQLYELYPDGITLEDPKTGKELEVDEASEEKTDWLHPLFIGAEIIDIQPEKKHLHGTARFATKRDLLNRGLLNDGLVFGQGKNAQNTRGTNEMNNLEKELKNYFYDKGYGNESEKEAADMTAFLKSLINKRLEVIENAAENIMDDLFTFRNSLFSENDN